MFKTNQQQPTLQDQIAGLLSMQGVIRRRSVDGALTLRGKAMSPRRLEGLFGLGLSPLSEFWALCQLSG